MTAGMDVQGRACSFANLLICTAPLPVAIAARKCTVFREDQGRRVPMPPPIVAAGRLRKSPFYEATVAAGAESFVTYNRMLIPRG